MSVFEGLYKSLYSKPFYYMVAHQENDNGKSWGFLALIALIQAVIISAIISISLMMVPDNVIDKVVDQVPEVKIYQGTLSIDKPSPYAMRFDEHEFAIIDVSDSASKKSADEIFNMMKQKDLDAYVTKTKAFTKKSGGKFEIIDLSDTQRNMRFDKEDVKNWVGIAKIFAIPFMIITFYIGIFIYVIAKMFIYSIAGLIIDNFAKATNGYAAIQRLTSYAIWPSILLWDLMLLLDLEYWFLLSFVVTIGYVYFAVKSSKAVIDNQL